MRDRFFGSRKRAGLTGLFVLIILAIGTGGADADISVPGSDIVDGTITTGKLSTTAKADLKGAKGDQGPPGVQGNPGPAGSPGLPGAGVVATRVTGADIPDYRSDAVVSTATLTAGDYLLYANFTANNAVTFHCALWANNTSGARLSSFFDVTGPGTFSFTGMAALSAPTSVILGCDVSAAANLTGISIRSYRLG